MGLWSHSSLQAWTTWRSPQFTAGLYVSCADPAWSADEAEMGRVWRLCEGKWWLTGWGCDVIHVTARKPSEKNKSTALVFWWIIHSSKNCGATETMPPWMDGTKTKQTKKVFFHLFYLYFVFLYTVFILYNIIHHILYDIHSLCSFSLLSSFYLCICLMYIFKFK